MLATIFPGQGSQSVGMGKDLAAAFPVARRTFEEADDALGFSLSALCFDGPASELQLTANAQPAILTCSIAALRALAELTPWRPDVVAGHSLGEYSALVAAEAITFTDAVRLVRARGELMQQAVPAGAGGMAALIGVDAAIAQALCDEAREGDEVLAPANFNGGRQVVVAGDRAALDRLLRLAKANKTRALPLKVSAPFHCEMMQSAADGLAERLAELDVRDPSVPVVANVDAEPNRQGARVRDLLERQVTAPVRWEQSVLRLRELGVSHVLEVGPGKVLAGLLRRIDKTLAVDNVGTVEQVRATAALLDSQTGVAAMARLDAQLAD